MDEKKTRKGRQKIAIEKIEKENDCYATFSKRRQGLFKKASELSTLCEADVGLLVFSPTGKPFSFFHPSMEAVVSRFRAGGGSGYDVDDASRLLEAFSRSRVLQLNQMIAKIGEKLEEEVEREKRLLLLDHQVSEMPVDTLDKEQLEHFMAFIRNLQLEFKLKTN